MAQERDNVKAGAFVLAAIVLAMIVVFTLSDFKRLFEKRQTVEVYYGLSDGLQGLKTGASVTLGDQPVGAVVHINDVSQGDRDKLIGAPAQPAGEPAIPDRIVGKIVTVSIPKHYQIYQNAIVELNAPPLGSGTKLNIRNVGYDRPYDGTRPIIGGVAGSPLAKNFVTEAGIGDVQREQIQHIIANVEQLTVTLRDDVPKISNSLQATLAKVGPVLDDIKTIAGDARQRSAGWFSRLDSITLSANDSLQRVNTLIKEKAPDLGKVIDNARDISQEAKDKTMVQITDALDKANDAMGSLKKTADELKVLIIGQRPVLERMMANFQLTSDQLKLAAIEVRRSPWRLLYKPGDQELTTDNLYDAARSFALAAGTLDAASRSLAAVANESPQDKQQVQKMLDQLQTLFKKYEEAEDAFWKALKGQKP